MAEIACEMLRTSLDAFVTGKHKTAKKSAKRDSEIDQLYDQVFRELLTYMLQDPRNINRATYLLWVAHNLERIGDRATNIAERVVFMATGKLKELGGSWDRDEPAIA
jgi:phosphate transport system protein